MLYSLLHLFGYGLTIDDLKQFRQENSLTPGHPEYGHTIGVEATTGPLGAGLSFAVGLAMAEAHLAATFNKDGYPIVDHYTFALGGDGCFMEGISSEALSLAGTLGLSKLIILYDSNKITIEGSTDIAFTENVQKRMEAFGFQTLTVEDGNDLAAVGAAIAAAKADKTRPSFITIKTHIGYASARQDMASSHGEPLGTELSEARRDFLRARRSLQPYCRTHCRRCSRRRRLEQTFRRILREIPRRKKTLGRIFCARRRPKTFGGRIFLGTRRKTSSNPRHFRHHD